VGWEVGTPVSVARPWFVPDYGSHWDQVGALLPLAYKQRAAVGLLQPVLWVGEGVIFYFL
jgi:hypothetical protein